LSIFLGERVLINGNPPWADFATGEDLTWAHALAIIYSIFRFRTDNFHLKIVRHEPKKCCTRAAIARPGMPHVLLFSWFGANAVDLRHFSGH
jgi:hypothetical protein